MAKKKTMSMAAMKKADVAYDRIEPKKAVKKAAKKKAPRKGK